MQKNDIELPNKKLPRREAFKYIALSPILASTLLTPSISQGNTQVHDIRKKIVIVGGGAGALMVLARLSKSIKRPNITIISPNKTHIYQAGQVLVGAGLMEYKDIFFDNKNYINEKDVTWVQDEVSLFHPKRNTVTTRKGKVVSYNYLIVATGIQYNYEKIKGLTKKDIGTYGITSVYLNDLEKGTAKGATDTWRWFRNLKNSAKIKTPKVIFTYPNTAIKCSATPQKTLFLAADYLKQSGLEAEFEFISSQNKVFEIPKIEKTLLKEQKRYGFVKNRLQHHLESIDVEEKKAIFIHSWEEKKYNEGYRRTELITKSERLELDYDFIHIVPPMSSVQPLLESDLVNKEGWLDVDKHTLQHKKYKNIFGIGDTCGVPMGKTGGSARNQGIVLTQNILDVIQNKRTSKKYDGYTVYPINTQYGKTMMAEFNYAGASPTLPLNFEKPRWIWWFSNLNISKPVYEHLMLTGKF